MAHNTAGREGSRRGEWAKRTEGRQTHVNEGRGHSALGPSKKTEPRGPRHSPHSLAPKDPGGETGGVAWHVPEHRQSSERWAEGSRAPCRLSPTVTIIWVVPDSAPGVSPSQRGAVSHLPSAGQAGRWPRLLTLIGMELSLSRREPWGTSSPGLHLCTELESRPDLGPRVELSKLWEASAL